MDERRLDPEFSERMEAFLQEVRSEPGQELPARTRSLAVLAALLGCQGLDEFRRALSEALEAGRSRRPSTRRWTTSASGACGRS